MLDIDKADGCQGSSRLVGVWTGPKSPKHASGLMLEYSNSHCGKAPRAQVPSPGNACGLTQPWGVVSAARARAWWGSKVQGNRQGRR